MLSESFWSIAQMFSEIKMKSSSKKSQVRETIITFLGLIATALVIYYIIRVLSHVISKK